MSSGGWRSRRAIGEGMRVEDSFLFGHTGEAFHDQVLRTASWIAVVVLAATVIAAVFRIERGSAGHCGAAGWRWRGDCLPAASLLRCGVAACAGARVFAVSVAMAAGVEPGAGGAGWAGAARQTRRSECSSGARGAGWLWWRGAWRVVAWLYFWQPCDDEDNVRAQVATFRDGGFEGTDEYTAAPADNERYSRICRGFACCKAPMAMRETARRGQNPEWQAGGADLQPSEIQIGRWDVERMSATSEVGRGLRGAAGDGLSGMAGDSKRRAGGCEAAAR